MPTSRRLTRIWSDDQLALVQRTAEQVGLLPEKFLRRQVELMLNQPDELFRQAASSVLQKNAERYRRLA